ncbi:MAG: hypothetical protein JWO17_1687 [Actinomycetia bacterium]|nr:hypothetical protein [Actinomycetes bacterium]
MATRDAPCVYLLRVPQPNDLDRVCVFLRNVHLDVQANEDGTLTASAPGARSPLHERREIGGYVTTWNALNPASPIAMVEIT